MVFVLGLMFHIILEFLSQVLEDPDPDLDSIGLDFDLYPNLLLSLFLEAEAETEAADLFKKTFQNKKSS